MEQGVQYPDRLPQNDETGGHETSWTCGNLNKC